MVRAQGGTGKCSREAVLPTPGTAGTTPKSQTVARGLVQQTLSRSSPRENKVTSCFETSFSSGTRRKNQFARKSVTEFEELPLLGPSVTTHHAELNPIRTCPFHCALSSGGRQERAPLATATGTREGSGSVRSDSRRLGGLLMKGGPLPAFSKSKLLCTK